MALIRAGAKNEIIHTKENYGAVHIDSKKELIVLDLLKKCGIEEDERYGKLGQWEQLLYDSRQSKTRDGDFKRLIRNAKKRYGTEVKPFIDCLRDSGVSPYHIGRFLRNEDQFKLAYRTLSEHGLLECYVDDDEPAPRRRIEYKTAPDGAAVSSAALPPPPAPAAEPKQKTLYEEYGIEDDSIAAQILRLSRK